MRNRALVILIIALFSVSFIIGCSNRKAASTNTKPTEANTKKTSASTSACFIDIMNDFKGVRDKATDIAAGKVVSSYSYILDRVIFTAYVVNVERQIKHEDKELPAQIEVVFTGGKLNGEDQPFFSGVKLPVAGQDYLFALAKLWPNKPEDIKYRLIGGDIQGMFNVTLDNKGKITQVLKFNDNNGIEKEVVGKNMEELLAK